jgi:hypothetical protein
VKALRELKTKIVVGIKATQIASEIHRLLSVCRADTT